MRPKVCLFPGTEKRWRVDRPVTAKMVWTLLIGSNFRKAGNPKKPIHFAITHIDVTDLAIRLPPGS